jgi:hypothetical protein
VTWNCPACNTQLRHSELEAKPRPGERYRCHICRLSLDFDPTVDRLVVAPLEADHQSDRSVMDRARTLPQPFTPKPKPRHK